jgi:Na+/H+-dicarboxylate symporter
MKDWFKYIVATVAGLALVLIFPESGIAKSVINTGAAVFENLGRYILIPFVFISFTSGIANLRRQKQAFKAVIYSLGWGVLTSLALTITAGLIAWKIFPANFSGVTGTKTISALGITPFSEFITGVINANILSSFTGDLSLLLPVVVFALLLGVALKPDEDFIRPAFAVMNSFSEAFYKLARILTELLILGVVFISAVWFAETFSSNIISDSIKLVFLIAVVTLLAVFLILPLLLVILGKTRKPYLWLFALIPPAILAWFSGSTLTAQVPLLLHTRNNLGVAKRVSSTSIPLLAIMGRSGSAMIGVVTVCSLYSTINGSSIPFLGLLLAIALTTLFSIICVATPPGTEILFIVAMTGSWMGNDFTSTLPVILPMMPFLLGAAALVDTISAGFGAGAISRILQAHSPVKAKDFL